MKNSVLRTDRGVAGNSSRAGKHFSDIIHPQQVQYAVEATLKLQREHLKSMEAKSDAVDDWDAYIEEYFKKVCWRSVPSFQMDESDPSPHGRPSLARNAAHGTRAGRRRVVSLASGRVR